jgi:hypothetical protein
VNETAFEVAIEAISSISRDLLDGLETTAPQKNREAEAEKSRERSRKRFAKVVA